MSLPDGVWTEDRLRELKVERMEEMRRIDAALHDLCQPLAVLQGGLELAEMIGTMEAYREAADKGLAECGRMAELVRSMRAIVQASWKISAEMGSADERSCVGR